MALAKLAQEDPTFKVRTEHHQRADDHRRHGRAASGDHRRPHDARVQGRGQRGQAAGELPRDHPRQSRGGRQVHSSERVVRASYGHAKIRIEPNEPGEGYEFSNDIKGGTIPKEYIKPIDQGIQEAMAGGVLAGYEMVDIQGARCMTAAITMLTSNEMAFQDRRFDGVHRRLRRRPSLCFWSR